MHADVFTHTHTHTHTHKHTHKHMHKHTHKHTYTHTHTHTYFKAERLAKEISTTTAKQDISPFLVSFRDQ